MVLFQKQVVMMVLFVSYGIQHLLEWDGNSVVWKSWIMLDIGVFFLQKILNNNYQMFQASQDETTKDNIDPSSLKL